jgi:hypothetical protein
MNNSQKATYILDRLNSYILDVEKRDFHRETLRFALRVALEKTPDEEHTEAALLRCCPIEEHLDPVDVAATQHLAAMIGASNTWPNPLFYNLVMGKLFGY